MPKFFTDQIDGSFARITGKDAAHIVKVLRMRAGEKLTLCDGAGAEYLCEITQITPGAVVLAVLQQKPSATEPTVRVVLYQGLPKSDKMDYIVQKSVELGVSRIVPVITHRCVSRPDADVLKSKTERWNRIAREAAKQCGRAAVPPVSAPLLFREATEEMARLERALLFYEESEVGTVGSLQADFKEIGCMIGAEGGFEPEEVRQARDVGISVTGLGPRILRTETAPLCVLSIIMYATGNL